MNLIYGIMFFVSAGLVGYIGLKRSERSQTLEEYASTEQIRDIPLGVPVVVSGTVVTQTPLTTPITQKPCVYYSYLLEREEITQRRRGSKFEWQVVGSPRTQSAPFYLQDASGKVLVKPDGCQVKGIWKTEQFLQPKSDQSNSAPGIRILSSVLEVESTISQNRERATEYTIPVNSELNVFGILTTEAGQTFFQAAPQYPLILSPLSKEQVLEKEEGRQHLFYGLAVIMTAIGIYFLSHAGF